MYTGVPLVGINEPPLGSDKILATGCAGVIDVAGGTKGCVVVVASGASFVVVTCRLVVVAAVIDAPVGGSMTG